MLEEAYLCELESWRNAPIDAKDSFRIEMMECSYGRGPTINAWAWFWSGWKQAMKWGKK